VQRQDNRLLSEHSACWYFDDHTRHAGTTMQILRRLIRKQGDSPGEVQDLINKNYVTAAPSPQNALDIFKSEWSSQFPPPFDNLRAGKITLFEDPRIKWLVSELSELRNQDVLELGPLEGGHSYMLEQSGVQSITAIESNTHAYLKCLIAKEVLGMRYARFLCGDFIQYLKDPNCPNFDIGIASGVLYHMVNPVELISLLAEHCRAHLFMWTHYYDEEWSIRSNLKAKFPSTQDAEYGGFSHTLVRQYYGSEGIASAVFCGGSRPYSNWMYREEMLKAVRYFGFPNIRIAFDQYDHPNGPSLAFIASRT
jgi:hypothetical protein